MKMHSYKSPEDSSCCKLTKSKPMKEFSSEEVSSWVDENLDGNMRAKFKGEFFATRVLK